MNIIKFLKLLSIVGFTFAFTNIFNNHNTNLENKIRIEELQRRMLHNADTLEEYKIMRKSLDEINQERELFINNISKLNEDHNTIQNTINKIEENNVINSENISKSTDLINELNGTYDKIVELINKSDGNGTNFTIDSNIFNELNNYISSLGPYDTLLFMHICGSIIILFCLFSILSIFYGEFFIIKFSLESRYPKLAKFIQLRRKFQQYYLFLNFILII